MGVFLKEEEEAVPIIEELEMGTQRNLREERQDDVHNLKHFYLFLK